MGRILGRECEAVHVLRVFLGQNRLVEAVRENVVVVSAAALSAIATAVGSNDHVGNSNLSCADKDFDFLGEGIFGILDDVFEGLERSGLAFKI